MPAMRGTALRSVNFPRGSRAYEKDDIPPHVSAPSLEWESRYRAIECLRILASHALPLFAFPVRVQNLAAKKEVQAAKVPDMLGAKKAGWNISTISDNMYRFPDRPNMRTLSCYDAHKRADYNYRAEELDSRATEMYIPRPNKFQVNERSLDVPRLGEPHHISRCEFVTHAALEGKPRWDPATGHGGDPYGVEKAQRKVLERERVEALEYSKKHPPKNRTESLVQREERFQREQRERKQALKAAAQLPGGGTATAQTFSRAFSATGSSGADPLVSTAVSFGSLGHGRTMPQFGATVAEPSKRVPVLKQTTWSLGGF